MSAVHFPDEFIPVIGLIFEKFIRYQLPANINHKRPDPRFPVSSLIAWRGPSRDSSSTFSTPRMSPGLIFAALDVTEETREGTYLPILTPKAGHAMIAVFVNEFCFQR